MPSMSRHWARVRGGSRGCAEHRKKRIAELREKIAAGTYVVDLARIVDALMARRGR